MILPFIILLYVCFAAGENYILSSTYQLPCGTDCLFDNYDSYDSYSYCYTERGWDYCSQSPSIDHQGNECVKPCKLIQNIYQCDIGGWALFPQLFPNLGYCSVTTSNPIQLDHAGNICTSACEKKLIPIFYTCNSMKPNGEKSLGFCSPSNNVDFQGKQCKSYAAYNGYSICSLQDGGMGYVGMIEDSGCPSREINTASNGCYRYGTTDGRRFQVQMTDNGDINSPDSTEIRYKTRWTVGQYNMKNDYIQYDEMKKDTKLMKEGTILNAPDFRMDGQGQTKGDDKNPAGYANIAIQFKSYVVAQILMPLGKKVPRKAIRSALLKSFKSKKLFKITEIK